MFQVPNFIKGNKYIHPIHLILWVQRILEKGPATENSISISVGKTTKTVDNKNLIFKVLQS